MIEVFECAQNSPEWEELRRGLVTASEFSTVLAKGKSGGESITRRRYMMRLAAERIGATPAESYTNDHMSRGHLLEAEARALYAFMRDVEPRLVGFVRNGVAGASPDAFLNEDGALEIKTRLPHLQVELLLSGEMPPEHGPQVQGQMWVTGRDYVDFVSYWPKLPLFVRRIYRDDGFIRRLANAVDQFNEEVDATVERVKRYRDDRPTLTPLEQFRASVEGNDEDSRP